MILLAKRWVKFFFETVVIRRVKIRKRQEKFGTQMKTTYSDKENCALSREQRSDKMRLANFVKLKVKGLFFFSLAFVLRK